ncbi:unnamed protein product, partial [Didymodactylos carnosus]
MQLCSRALQVDPNLTYRLGLGCRIH